MPDVIRRAGSRRPDAERVRRRAPVVLAAVGCVVLVLAALLVVVAGPWSAPGPGPADDHGHAHTDEDGHAHEDEISVNAIPAPPNAAEGRLLQLDRVKVGDCLNDTAVVGGAVRVLGCSSPHRFEVYATATLDGAGPAPTEPLARGGANVELCAARLQEGKLRAAAADTTTLVDAVDDFTAAPTGRRLLCTIGYNDFRQTVGHRAG